jgi:ATP-dependent exoDNAse (exonuclease V) beta subunit
MVGQVVHRALELWKFPGGDESSFIDWAQAEFRNLGLIDEKDFKDGYRKVRKMLERFQDSDLYKRMINSSIVKHEIPFSEPQESGIPRIGVIDALFKEEDNWILVEFKTDQINPRYAQAWINKKEKYKKQVSEYLEAAEKILDIQPEPMLCFLNYDGAIQIETDLW